MGRKQTPTLSLKLTCRASARVPHHRLTKGVVMLAGLLALALVVMKLDPTIPFARSLHQWLVEWPLEAAARMERRHLILIGVILFCGPSLAAFGSAEIGMLYAVDLSLYVEAVLVTSLSAAGASVRRAWATVVSSAGVLRRGRPRPRSRRARASTGKKNTASNDDGPAWAAMAA